MLVPADVDVVVNRYPKRGRDIDDGAGHVDVRLRRRRIAAWIVVHQDYREMPPSVNCRRIRRGQGLGAS
jgi:hypothetical protein